MDITLIIILVFGIFIFLSSFFTVKQQSSVIIERFGKFLSVRNSGLQLKIPLIDRIAGRGRRHPSAETAGRTGLHVGGHYKNPARSRLETARLIRGGRRADAEKS